MLTEEEAKTKWCPFTDSMSAMTTAYTTTEAGPVQFTSSGRQSPHTKCIGRQCMAWEFPNTEDEFGQEKPQTKFGFCKRIERRG